MTEKVKRSRTGESKAIGAPAVPSEQKIYERSNYQTQNIDIPVRVRSTIQPHSHCCDWINMWHFMSHIFLLKQRCFYSSRCLFLALLWKIRLPTDDPLRKQSSVSWGAALDSVSSIKILSTWADPTNCSCFLCQCLGATAPCWWSQAFHLR